jgi:hypothetical protein
VVGRVIEVQYQGAVRRVVVGVGPDRLAVALPAAERPPEEGAEVRVVIPVAALNRMEG